MRSQGPGVRSQEPGAHRVVGLLASGFWLLISPPSLLAQTYTPPRTPDGHPDLQGVLTNGTIAPRQRLPEFLETTNFNDKTRLRGADEHVRLVERFTRVDLETINYEFTMNDRTAFTQPWTTQIPMKRTEGPILEYACHEGYYAMAASLPEGVPRRRPGPKRPPNEAR